MNQPLPETPQPFYSGKVRDLYPADEDRMIIVASDRISAFDVVFPDPMPGKGEALNSISVEWFRFLRKCGLMEELGFSDHLIASDLKDFPEPYNRDEYFRGRSMYVKKTQRIDYECVVRGYIVGSGWKDYQNSGAVCGHQLPQGLRLADKLEKPLFTPATKAPLGEHDENVSLDHMVQALGADLANRLAEISLRIYETARDRLESEGVILCDTKFEFGLDGDEIVLIDEVLTPDSSRYWDEKEYEPGKNPPSFDKQIVRDYLETTDWNKKEPAPALPGEIMDRTMSRYREIQEKLMKLNA